MLFTDTYKTVSAQSSGEFKDKGSKFIGLVFPITNESEVKEIVQAIKKEHFTAAHHCYAYILGTGKELQKSNDDREPNNTAGKPILRSILSKDLTNTLVVVVRYFGGKLLGVPGLINAYYEAANDALNHAPITEKIICEQHKVTGNYEHENEVYKAYKTFGAKLLQHTYNENTFCSIFEIRKTKASEIINHLNDKRLFALTFIKEQ